MKKLVWTEEKRLTIRIKKETWKMIILAKQESWKKLMTDLK
jgi:hypothetical protein